MTQPAYNFFECFQELSKTKQDVIMNENAFDIIHELLVSVDMNDAHAEVSMNIALVLSGKMSIEDFESLINIRFGSLGPEIIKKINDLYFVPANNFLYEENGQHVFKTQPKNPELEVVPPQPEATGDSAIEEVEQLNNPDSSVNRVGPDDYREKPE